MVNLPQLATRPQPQAPRAGDQDGGGGVERKRAGSIGRDPLLLRSVELIVQCLSPRWMRIC